MAKKFNQYDLMMEWEGGNLTNEEYLKLFASLIADGKAWSLQGMYGREASNLIEAGLIDKKGKITLYGRKLIVENGKEMYYDE
jgi:hypothetical protein